MNERRVTGNSGFTLIEIVVVVLIIGLIALLVLPRIGGLSGGNLKSVIRHLTGAIQTLRDEADARQRIFRLNFNLSEQGYDVSELKENGEFIPYRSESLGKVQFPGYTRLKDVVTQRQGKVTEGIAYVYFYPLGRVEKAYLHFEEGGQPVTLQVMPLSGKVKWYDGYIEEQ